MVGLLKKSNTFFVVVVIGIPDLLAVVGVIFEGGVFPSGGRSGVCPGIWNC